MTPCLRSVSVAVTLALFGAALPTPAAADDVEVVGAWVRLPPPGSNAAVYALLRNTTTRTLRVVNVHSGAAERAELHESVIEDGVARMRPVESIELPPEGAVELAPGGLHAMLIQPRPLHEGEAVGLVFGLSNGTTVRAAAPVRREPPGHDAGTPEAGAPGPKPETGAEPDHSHHH